MNEKNRLCNAKSIAIYGVFTALAIVFGYIEHLVPLPIGIYGIKLGISNIVTLTALYLFGSIPALLLNVARILISSLLFGNVFSLAYSLAGGVTAALVMIAAKRYLRLGVTGVSICGGVMHNVAQLCVAVLITEQIRISFYLPVLLTAGAVTGFIIGAVALPIIKNSSLKRLLRSKTTTVKKEK